MLNIQNLSFRIEGRLLFDNASANIPKGHKVGLVGRNGTGKTTLFRLIKSEWTPESGLIFIPKDYKVGGVDQEAPSSENSLLDGYWICKITKQTQYEWSSLSNSGYFNSLVLNTSKMISN